MNLLSVYPADCVQRLVKDKEHIYQADEYLILFESNAVYESLSTSRIKYGSGILCLASYELVQFARCIMACERTSSKYDAV